MPGARAFSSAWTRTIGGLLVPPPRVYTTAFGSVADPLSEGGNWVGGWTLGLDWNDVQSIGGLATLSAVDRQGGADFSDATALLTGSWSPNVRITGVAKHSPVSTTNFRELEFRLRGTLAPHVNSGYEVNFGIGALGPYTQVVRWNGPHGGLGVGFDYVNSGLSGAPTVNDGDTCKVEIRGNIIKVFVNGTQFGGDQNVASIAGPVFTTGNPGIGFYNNISTAYGWKSILVEEI